MRSSATTTTTTPSDDTGLLDYEESEVLVDEELVLAGAGARETSYPPGTFRKIVLGMATLVVAMLSTYVVPGLERARPWTAEDPVPFWNLFGRGFENDDGDDDVDVSKILAQAQREDDDAPLLDRSTVRVFDGESDGTSERESESSSSSPGPEFAPHPDDALDVPLRLELGAPDALVTFFERLRDTELGIEGSKTRVVHWGDSVIGNDFVSSTLRAKLQRRFGDAGPGFHLLAKNNPSYRHQVIQFSGGDGWSICYIIFGCRKDGHYGLGGTTVNGTRGAKSRFATATKSANGRKISRFELWFAGQPGGGTFRVQVDDGEPEIVESVAESLEDRWHVVGMDDGEHRVTVSVESGRVRAYGVVLERDVPGVVWDGMSQVGAFTERMLGFDLEHLERQLERRDPALLVFQFGGNDLQLKRGAAPRFETHLTSVIRNFRGAQGRACLVVAPVDHGERQSGRIVSVEAMQWLVPSMRRVALAEGCAFFDTPAAMGGRNAVAKWRTANPPLISGDLAHLTQAGQQVLGQMIYLALMAEYVAWRSR